MLNWKLRFEMIDFIINKLIMETIRILYLMLIFIFWYSIWFYSKSYTDEMICNFLCKKEDYTIQEWQLLKNAKVNADLLDLSFTWLKEWNQDQERKSKLQQLAMNMVTYSDKFQINLDVLTSWLYEKYNITSRRQLKDSDLDAEIEMYKTSIMSWIA